MEDDKEKTKNNGAEPQSWPALIWKILLNPQAIGFVVILLSVGFFGATLAGYDVLGSLGLKKLLTEEAQVLAQDFPTSDPVMRACIEKAIKLGKPYVLQSVTEVVHIHLDTKKNTKTSDFTVTYTMLLLRDIKKEDRLFKEYFSSVSPNFKYSHVYGSAEELLRGQGETYDVIFEVKKGQTKTVVTSGRYMHTLPYPPRYALGEQLLLGARDDTWNYPNQEDVIREFTMVLTADNAEIEPVGQAAGKRFDDKRKLFADNVRFARVSDQNARPSISAQWESIMPGEELAIHYKW